MKQGYLLQTFYLKGLIKTSSACKYLQEINSGGPGNSLGDSHAPELFKSTPKLLHPSKLLEGEVLLRADTEEEGAF